MLLVSKFFEKPTCDEPCLYGFCDIINQVVRKRAWARDFFARDAKESDLRTRLIEKRAVIEKAIAGKDKAFAENYVRRVLKNKLINEQTRGEGRIISNSTISLSDDTFRTDRKALSRMNAGNELTDVTGGDSAARDDDFSLDAKGTLVAPETDSPGFGKGNRHEAQHLFDKMQAEALATISTLTGGRKDGFDTRLDLEKALRKLPEDEQNVFAARFLENGVLLNRPRSRADAEFMTGFSTQNLRTLERKAIEKLRPALSPAFFKRRLS